MKLFLFVFANFDAFFISSRYPALEESNEDYEIASDYMYSLYDKLLEDFLYFDYLTEMITP